MISYINGKKEKTGQDDWQSKGRKVCNEENGSQCDQFSDWGWLNARQNDFVFISAVCCMSVGYDKV